MNCFDNQKLCKLISSDVHYFPRGFHLGKNGKGTFNEGINIQLGEISFRAMENEFKMLGKSWI